MEDVQLDQAPLADASMMDANIDDLFGDGGADLVGADGLGVPLAVAPLPPKLVSRIAEMQWKGCCTKLVWSNAGYIAQIVESGRKISLRTTLRNAKSGEWDLTDESKHPIEAPEGTTFKHIETSGLGTEFAVVDNHGRVSVYSSLHLPLGRVAPSPMQSEDSKNLGSDLDAVVGLHWLAMYPNEFRVPYITPARKVGERWTSQMRHRDQQDPTVHHAADQRNAFLYVSRDANLTLMFQIEGMWHSVANRMENLVASDEMLNHAALGEDGDHLLLVTHDLTQRFKLYRISIAWNSSQQTRSGGASYTAVAPTLDVGHLTTVDNVAAQHADAARLSYLKIVPAVPNFVEYGTPTFPTIVAVFTRVASLADQTQQPQDSFSVISRWHLEMVTPTMHESFLKLKKTNSITPTQAPVTVLRRQEDIVTNRIVTSVSGQTYNTIICFPASDASLEYRDRATMTHIEPYGESDVVSSLPQSGFEHLLIDHNTHVATSADGSAVVYQQMDAKLAVKTMALRYSWHPLDDGISDTSGLIEAAVVCVARQYAMLSVSQLANDENLALLPRNLSTELRALFVKEIVKFTNRPIDISGQEQRNQAMMAIKEGFLHKALSAQLILGTKMGSNERNVVGKFAYCFLNLRASAQLLAQMITQANQYIRPDVLHSMRGAARWGCEMLVYVAIGLVDTAPKIHAGAGENAVGSSVKEALQKHLVEEAESPTAHLLLNAFTRAFLKFLAQSLPKYLTAIQRVLPAATSVLQRQQLQEMYDHCTSPNLPFKYSDFETLLQSIDASVRQAYTSAGLPPDRRAEIELQTLCDAQLPDELSAPLQILLDAGLPTFTAACDQSKLFFWDTTWLGIDSAAGARNIDAVRKLPLSKEATLRSRLGPPLAFDLLLPLLIPRDPEMAPALRSRPLNRSELPKAITNAKAPIKTVLFSESLSSKPSSLVPNIRSISWSPTGSMIATCTSAQMRIWDPERANVKLSTEIRNGHNGSFAGGPGGPASGVERVAFCPAMENVLASTGNDGGVRLWDVRMPGSGAGAVGKGTQMADCKLGDSGISMLWHPDGREIVVGTKEDYVKVLDVRRMTDYGAGAVASWEMECADRTPAPKKRLHGMAFSNSGHELFLTTGEGPVKILDYQSLETLHTLAGHSDATYCVAHSPQGSYVAVGGADSIVSLWDTNSWHCSHMLTEHTSAVRDISFSFDGTFLTAGSMLDSKDGSKGMEIYHVDSGEVAHTLETVNPVTASTWHPLRYWVAFAGDPGGLKILGAGSSL